MKKFNHTLLSVLLLSTITLLSSCKSNTDSEDSNFDRPKMLKNYSENIIAPSYDMLQDSVDELQSSAVTFSNTPNTQNLAALQQNLKGARLAWQNANLFEFGPAEMQLLRTSLNTYPADTTKISDNINSGSYNLGSLDNQDAAGFPAVGFLIYGDDKTDSEIVSQFTNETNAQNRMDYLLDNITFVKENVDAVASKWKTDDGNYAGTFLSEKNSGTDVGSSMGMLINAMVLHYERFLRDGKIGFPAGVRSAGIPSPSATEAYYGGYSVELAIENMQAFKRLYLGIGLNGNDGLGLQENLDAVGTATLADEIETKIDQSLDKLNALNDPLSQQVDSNNDPVVAAFQSMQEVVTLVKADMTSALGITITFQDNDGD